MFDEGRYSAGQLKRNRIVIGMIVLAAVVACAIAAAAGAWGWSNGLGMMAVACVFGAALWWAFASRKAGPLQVNAGSWNRFRRTWFMKTE